MLTKGISVTTSLTEEIERFDKVSSNRYARNLLQGGYTSKMKHSAGSQRAVSNQQIEYQRGAQENWKVTSEDQRTDGSGTYFVSHRKSDLCATREV
jgi:hypothetical protein